MASKKFEKGSPEWMMFQDYWKLCQKFWVPEDNERYWEQVGDGISEFFEKHKGVNKEFIEAISEKYADLLHRKRKEEMHAQEREGLNEK